MAGRPEQGRTRRDAIAGGEKLAGGRRIGDSGLHWSRKKHGEQDETMANPIRQLGAKRREVVRGSVGRTADDGARLRRGCGTPRLGAMVLGWMRVARRGGSVFMALARLGKHATERGGAAWDSLQRQWRILGGYVVR